jgi:hypothetical protein
MKIIVERITIVIINPPSEKIKDDSSSRVSVREFAECDRFANELQNYTVAKVTIIEHYPKTVLPTEFVILYTGNLRQVDPKFLNKFRKRIIVMDTGATGDFEELYKYGLAGVVGYRLYWFWVWGRNVFVMPCFLGLTVVAKEMKVRIIREMRDYCDMTDDVTFPTLPVFLLQYLEAYQKMIS